MQNNYKKLKIWQESMNLAVSIYKITADISISEKYGLISQMRKCAVSIPSNIAEGAGRGTDPQFIYFLNIAQGSAFELETQLFIALDLSFIHEITFKEIFTQVNTCKKLLNGFIKYHKSIIK